MTHLTCTVHKQRVKVVPVEPGSLRGSVVHTGTGLSCRTQVVRYRESVLTPDDVLDGATKFRNSNKKRGRR